VNNKDKSEPVVRPISESLSTDEMPKQSEKEVHVNYEPSPSHPPPGQKIHPRQKMPPVPEGESVEDDAPSPPVDLDWE
jgi:hypothetical protein